MSASITVCRSPPGNFGTPCLPGSVLPPGVGISPLWSSLTPISRIFLSFAEGTGERMNSEKFLSQRWLPIWEAFRFLLTSQFSWTDILRPGVDKAYSSQTPFLMYSTEFWKSGGFVSVAALWVHHSHLQRQGVS